MPTTIKRGDTWPPLRGLASDEEGPIDMTTADTITLLAKYDTHLISGAVVALASPDADGFNWSYTWSSGDTAIVGVYSVELEIDWGGGHIETIPNDGTETLHIVQDQGGQ